jgi:aspartate 4-decarboxylase
MTQYSLFDLPIEGQEYKRLLRDIVHRRLGLPMEGVGPHISDDPGRAAYYIDLDPLAEARALDSSDFVSYLERNYEPADVVFGHHLHVILEEYRQEWHGSES